MKVTALIMAGGKGERFWPRSRVNYPKQFLSLTGDGKSMIRHTVDRISSVVKPEDVYIATNAAYKELVKEQLPEIPEENILLEPVGRNTAPCIGLGAAHIRKKDGDAIMLVLPSDHIIKYGDIYVEALKDAIKVADEDGRLVTIGIRPNAPETGYGYIKFNKEEKCESAFKVDRFVEKPNLEKAKEYVSTGEYMWNSGMFVWKASTILGCIEKHLPEIYSGICTIEKSIGTSEADSVLDTTFKAMPSESIDYGVLEKESNIYVIPGDFGWDDVGSWLAVGRMQSADEADNVTEGNVIMYNTKDCIIQGEDRLIATVGIENLVVVDTKDALLICSKDSTNDIKKITENLRNDNKNQYL